MADMKTFAYTLELVDDPDMIAKYREYHKNVWPEVLKGIRETGVLRSKIFLLGNRLFMIVEAEDSYCAQTLQSYTADPKSKEWDELMRCFQKPVREAKEGEWWAEMDLVYDFEQQIARLDSETDI